MSVSSSVHARRNHFSEHELRALLRTQLEEHPASQPQPPITPTPAEIEALVRATVRDELKRLDVLKRHQAERRGWLAWLFKLPGRSP